MEQNKIEAVVDFNHEMLFKDVPSLDQYLTLGTDIFAVIKQYVVDLRGYGLATGNRLELHHAAFLEKYLGIITNDHFVENIQMDLQAKFLDEIYHSKKDFSFAIRGRIKSLMRLENKYNDYVQSFVKDYIVKHSRHPSTDQVIKALDRFRDVIAYRFILHSKDRDEEKAKAKLVSIASEIPGYFNAESLDPTSRGGYTLIKAPKLLQTTTQNTSVLPKAVRPYYKDYVSNPKEFGFQAFTIVMEHNISGHVFELQLETFEMLKHNEHSEESHHGAYEAIQSSRRLASSLPDGWQDRIFSEAHTRIVRMKNLKLSDIRVDMFFAFSEEDVEDLCGLLYGRQSHPREFL